MKSKIDVWLEAAAPLRQNTNRLDALGKAIDVAGDIVDVKCLAHADTTIEKFLAEIPVLPIQAILNYYRANIWSACRCARDTSVAYCLIEKSNRRVKVVASH